MFKKIILRHFFPQLKRGYHNVSGILLSKTQGKEVRSEKIINRYGQELTKEQYIQSQKDAEKRYREQMDGFRNKNIVTSLLLLGFVAGIYKYSISAVEDASDTFSQTEIEEIQMEIDQELAEQRALETKLSNSKK